jgi:hypothetical protein
MAGSSPWFQTSSKNRRAKEPSAISDQPSVVHLLLTPDG